MNQYVDLACDLGVELYVNCVCAVSLDGVLHNDLALVDLDLVLCEKCFCDILCGNGAVELAVVALLDLDLYYDSLKLCRCFSCSCLFKLDLAESCRFLVLISLRIFASASTASFFGKRKLRAYPSETLITSSFLPCPLTSCKSTTFIILSSKMGYRFR